MNCIWQNMAVCRVVSKSTVGIFILNWKRRVARKSYSKRRVPLWFGFAFRFIFHNKIGELLLPMNAVQLGLLQQSLVLWQIKRTHSLGTQNRKDLSSAEVTNHCSHSELKTCDVRSDLREQVKDTRPAVCLELCKNLKRHLPRVYFEMTRKLSYISWL